LRRTDMKWNALLVVLALACLLMVGCKNVEKLGPGNELALENQGNLEKNMIRVLDNMKKIYASEGTDEQKKALAKQRAEIVEQLVINYAWLLTIKKAVESNDIDPGFFTKVLGEAPGWIEQGKNIADMVKGMSEDE